MTAVHYDNPEQFLKNVDPKGLPSAADLPAGLRQIQKEGHQRFQGLRLPTREAEDWRYMPLKPIVTKKYHVTHEQVNPQCDVFNRWRGPATCQYVFNNGYFSQEESSPYAERKGLRITRLCDLDKAGLQRLHDQLELFNSDTRHPFEFLNQALLRPGLFIEVDDNVELSEPILIAYFSSEFDQNFITNPRNVICLGKNSRATILESYLCFSDMPYFTNAVSDIMLGSGARLDYARVQSESAQAFHLGTTRVRQAADSCLHAFSMSIGSRIARHDLSVRFLEPGAQTHVNGLYGLDGDGFQDHHTQIAHSVPHCSSHQLYKGILDERSRAVFNGKVLVAKGAHHSDSLQLNKNLLLSRSARINTKPQLEIDNDDVKCVHGATIGQLNAEEVFYLESRGISRESAIPMLVDGFAGDVLARIPDKFLRNRCTSLLKRYYTRMKERANA